LLAHFFVSAKHGALHAKKRFDDHVIYICPQQVDIDAQIFKVILQRRQGPLVAEVLLSCIFILNESVTFLVHTVVSQVAELFLLV